jgi:hypothetical protein
VNDLLLRIPGDRGGLPRSTKISGIMDPTFAARGPFAPFSGLESDHAAGSGSFALMRA